MNAQEFGDYWKTRIEKDLTPFADPSTPLEIRSEGRSIWAKWQSRERMHEARFSISMETGVQVAFQGRNASYRSFLAGPEMADLLGLAKMIQRRQRSSIFIPTRARKSDGANGAVGPAISLLRGLIDNRDEKGVTEIVFVTGDAGAGKTHVLQELVRQQAADYQLGRTECLYLYVNAQGRALARFNEALATELQDLRAALTYHAIPSLVRLGVIIPVIDGFDELLGVGGYDDAFSSLSGFIQELDGLGRVVASARSTYYEQEFVERASRATSIGGQAWSQIPIEVLSWGDAEFSEYIKVRYAREQSPALDSETFESKVTKVFAGKNSHLREKPLFVVKTVDFILKDPNFSGGDNLLQELVNAFLERERSDKLLDRDGAPLISSQQMLSLMTGLAEEMWNQETRELDKRSVKEVAQFVMLSEGVADAAQKVVIERMPTLAFMTPGEVIEGIAFEHEIFFSYFLALVFADRLDKSTSGMGLLLGRSMLPAEVADAAIDHLFQTKPRGEAKVVQDLVTQMSKAAAEDSSRTAQIKENAGLLVAMILRHGMPAKGSLENLKISGVVFPGIALGEVALKNGTFANVQFRRVDFSHTKFVACSATNISLIEVTVDPPTTRLELAGLDIRTQVHGLRFRKEGALHVEYDPAEVHKKLAECGAVAPIVDEDTQRRLVDDRIIDLLERLVRTYRRTNPVCTSDDNLRQIFADRNWGSLERLLLDQGILTKETRPTGGRPKAFLRRQVLPEHILAGRTRNADVPQQVIRFWDSLERQFPKRRKS